MQSRLHFGFDCEILHNGKFTSRPGSFFFVFFLLSTKLDLKTVRLTSFGHPKETHYFNSNALLTLGLTLPCFPLFTQSLPQRDALFS